MSSVGVAAAVAGAKHGALQAGEGEMRLGRAEQRPRQRHGGGIARPRRALDRGAAGKAEAEQLGGLVERLAGGVVDGGGEAPVAAEALDVEQLAMAAGDEEQQIGEGEARIAQHRRQAHGLRDG